MSTALSILSWIYSHISKFFSTLMRVIALCISGLAIGWIMGLSVAPTVQHVITEVLALVVAIMGILAGIKAFQNAEKSKPATKTNGTTQAKETDNRPDEANPKNFVGTDREQENQQQPPNTESNLAESARRVAVDSLWPVAGFMAGLMLGSTAGLLARTNQLLGPNPKLLALRWNLDSTQQKLLTERLLLKSYGLQPVEEKVLGAKKSGKKNSSANPKKPPTAPRKPCAEAAMKATPKQPVFLKKESPKLSQAEIAVFYNGHIAGFCGRARSHEGDELKVDLRRYIRNRLNDTLVPDGEARQLKGWESQIDDADSLQLTKIQLLLCEKLSR